MSRRNALQNDMDITIQEANATNRTAVFIKSPVITAKGIHDLFDFGRFSNEIEDYGGTGKYYYVTFSDKSARDNFVLDAKDLISNLQNKPVLKELKTIKIEPYKTANQRRDELIAADLIMSASEESSERGRTMERDRNNNNNRSKSPGRGRSPAGRSPSPYRGKSSNSYRGKSPNSYRGKSPNSYRGKSPNSYRGKSPNSYRGKSPNSYRGKSPNSYRGKSPNSYKGKSPKRSNSPKNTKKQTKPKVSNEDSEY